MYRSIEVDLLYTHIELPEDGLAYEIRTFYICSDFDGNIH